MCGLCASRCPGEIVQYYVGILCRRLYAKYLTPKAGHVAQNVALQAVALNLASVVIGAFRDREVQRLLKLAPNEMPLYLIPVGKPAPG